jgi:hypothetical protein
LLGFPKWFYLIEGLLYFTYFEAAVPFRLSKKDWEESNRGKAAKKLYETPM